MGEWRVTKLELEDGRVLRIGSNGEYVRIRSVGLLPISLKLQVDGMHNNPQGNVSYNRIYTTDEESRNIDELEGLPERITPKTRMIRGDEEK